MGTKFELATRDGGSFSVYRAEPPAEVRGVVVVVQEIFGVNHHIRAVCDRLAEAMSPSRLRSSTASSAISSAAIRRRKSRWRANS
jgi:hypothetical protein